MHFDKDMVRGGLELMVLSTLKDGPLYGHLIQKRIREVTGERVKLPGGTLYPLLHRLELDGAISARQTETPEGNRRWYELTARGRQLIDHQAHQWRQLSACIAELIGGATGAAEGRALPGAGIGPEPA